MGWPAHINQHNKSMKQLIKLPKVNPAYIISSEDDTMYAVVEYGETLAHIVETIDQTRQTLYYPDGGEMHLENHTLEMIVNRHVTGKTNFDMACMWFEENEFIFLHDRGNGSIELYVENPDKTQLSHFQISQEEINYRAELWKESRG